MVPHSLTMPGNLMAMTAVFRLLVKRSCDPSRSPSWTVDSHGRWEAMFGPGCNQVGMAVMNQRYFEMNQKRQQ